MQDIHSVVQGLLFKVQLFVLLVADALLHSGHFNTISFLDVAAGGLEDEVHHWSQANILSNWTPCTLVLHFPQHFLVHLAV